MPSSIPLCTLLGVNPKDLSKNELVIIEAELFAQSIQELIEIYREELKTYFRFMKFNSQMENIMLETNCLRLIINDILSTDEYTMSGLARYSNTHEDIIYEVASGKNTTPSAILFRNILELHRNIRKELYRSIMKKIVSKYLKNDDDDEET